MLKKISEDLYFDFSDLVLASLTANSSKITFQHRGMPENYLFATEEEFKLFRAALEEYSKPPTLSSPLIPRLSEVSPGVYVPFPDPKMRLKTPDEHEF